MQFQRFLERLSTSDTAFVRMESEELREDVGWSGGAAATIVAWRAWARSAFTRSAQNVGS